MSWPWPFLRIAHRGIPTRAPANSLEGFALAMSLGADMLETDLRLSADGALVLAHDGAVAVPGRRPVAIAGATLAELRRLAPLATLDEALALRHHGAPPVFNLDLKVAGIADSLLRALRRSSRREGILLTGHRGPAGATFATVRAAAPWVAAALTQSADPREAPGHAATRALLPWTGALVGRRLVRAARTAGLEALTVEHTLATSASVAACHQAGLRLLVWTVDSPVRMRALLAAGVDGITTNAVDVLSGLERFREV